MGCLVRMTVICSIGMHNWTWFRGPFLLPCTSVFVACTFLIIQMPAGGIKVTMGCTMQTGLQL